MRNTFFFIATILLSVGILGNAYALSVTATLTADNHYALYHGNEDGTDLNFVGNNETGSSGNPGQYNWSDPETYDFDVNAGDYLYVVGWSDDSTAQGWIGEFDLGGDILLSDTQNWEYYLTNQDLDTGDSPPSISDLQGNIANAQWTSVSKSIANGDGPWGNMASLSENAKWIWGTDLEPGSGEGEYQIFRAQVVPEPATMMLLGLGLVGLAGLKRKLAHKS